MFLWYQFKYFLSRYTIIISLFILICVSLLLSMFYIEKVEYVNDLIDFYETKNNNAIGILSSINLANDMFYYYDENRVLFFLGDDTSESVNGFTGIVIQEIKETNYTDLSYYTNENIYKGDFRSLEMNEIVVSKDLSDKFNLHVGDKVYVTINRDSVELQIASILKPTNHIIHTNPDRQTGLILINKYLDLKSTYEYNYIHFFNESTALQSYSEDIIILSETVQTLDNYKEKVISDYSLLAFIFYLPILIIVNKLALSIYVSYKYVTFRYKLAFVLIFDLLLYMVLLIGVNYLIGKICNIYNFDLFIALIMIMGVNYIGILCYNFLIYKMKVV